MTCKCGNPATASVWCKDRQKCLKAQERASEPLQSTHDTCQGVDTYLLYNRLTDRSDAILSGDPAPSLDVGGYSPCSTATSYESSSTFSTSCDSSSSYDSSSSSSTGSDW